MYLIKNKIKFESISINSIDLGQNTQKKTTTVVFLKSPKHFNVGKQKIKFTNKNIKTSYTFKKIFLQLR